MAMRTDRRMRTVPFEELGPFPAGQNRPVIATVREIDAEVDGDISFFFSRGTFAVDLRTYGGGLPGLVEDVRAGTFQYVDNLSSRPQPPMTPLSLNNQRLSYVIYKLRSRNWQFARKHPPFSIGKKGKDANAYFEAMRVDRHGVAEPVDPLKAAKDGSMVAYFIADGAKATGFTGRYVHALNVHVDLLFGSGGRGYMPLVIDPDVRHPGGSGA